MLAYPLDEAESMLQSKLEAASNTLKTCEEDLDYLREQITVRFFLLFFSLCDPLPKKKQPKVFM